MKKQNVIIIVIFIVLISGFYLYQYFDRNEEEVVETLEEESVEEDITMTDEMNSIEISFCDVYVHGEVYKADLYHIPSNWTLEKLFSLAELKASADISGYNLAEIVENNKEYYIPKKISNLVTDFNLLVNINTASKEELMLIPGIGEVIAENIIIYRQKNVFKNIEEIKNVSGIGDAIYEKIKNYITIR